MEYMTPQEVAEKFKVSKQTIFKWIELGKLRVERIAGTTIRIRVEEVEKLIQRR